MYVYWGMDLFVKTYLKIILYKGDPQGKLLACLPVQCAKVVVKISVRFLGSPGSPSVLEARPSAVGGRVVAVVGLGIVGRVVHGSLFGCCLSQVGWSEEGLEEGNLARVELGDGGDGGGGGGSSSVLRRGGVAHEEGGDGQGGWLGGDGRKARRSG